MHPCTDGQAGTQAVRVAGTMRAFGSLVQLACVGLATEPKHRVPSSGWTADHVASVRIALYCSGGASSCKTPSCCEPNVKYYATLYAAAKIAFGDSGFSIANLTAAEVVRLDASQHDVVVFPGGSGECPSCLPADLAPFAVPLRI